MSDHDEWRNEVSFLTEFERAIDCTHTNRQGRRFCPDCGDETPTDTEDIDE